MNYKKTFKVTIVADLNDLNDSFVEAHQHNWLSNLKIDDDGIYITPTEDEMTKSLASEFTSWLTDLGLEPLVKDENGNI